MSELPVRRSAEHLRKQAKRSARAHLISLAKAQHLLANEYGYRTWAQLIRDAALRADVRNSSPLFAAVRSGDVETVRRVPAAGANPNPGDGVDTPLHLAACRGPLSSSRRSLPAARLNGRRMQRDAYPWTSLNAENRLRDLRSSRYLIARLLQMHRCIVRCGGRCDTRWRRCRARATTRCRTTAATAANRRSGGLPVGSSPPVLPRSKTLLVHRQQSDDGRADAGKRSRGRARYDRPRH